MKVCMYSGIIPGGGGSVNILPRVLNKVSQTFDFNKSVSLTSFGDQDTWTTLKYYRFE